MLEVNNIHTYYGESYILQGVSLKVEEGEAVALIGRNGVGKTTLLKSIMGVQVPREGKIYFKGDEITGLPPNEIARKGIVLVPEDRRIIPNLTVYENLKLGMMRRGKVDKQKMSEALEEIFSYFPRLKERLNQKGGSLSGGEQQMLTIGRALISNPELLLIDEPMEGLMPILVQEIAAILKRLHEEGRTILLVESNADVALDIVQRIYIMMKGKIRLEATIEEVRKDRTLIEKYLGIKIDGIS